MDVEPCTSFAKLAVYHAASNRKHTPLGLSAPQSTKKFTMFFAPPPSNPWPASISSLSPFIKSGGGVDDRSHARAARKPAITSPPQKIAGGPQPRKKSARVLQKRRHTSFKYYLSSSLTLLVTHVFLIGRRKGRTIYREEKHQQPATLS